MDEDDPIVEEVSILIESQVKFQLNLFCLFSDSSLPFEESRKKPLCGSVSNQKQDLQHRQVKRCKLLCEADKPAGEKN